MPRTEDTETLAELFFENRAGAEDSDLDFKGMEKLTEKKTGKHEIVKVLSAMANTDGGTIIVGIGEGSRKDIMQSFPEKSEIKRDLYHTARMNTDPSVAELMDISFDQVFSGVRLLRIDVDRSRGELIRFKTESGTWDAFRRVGDTTFEMAPDEVASFIRDRWRPSSAYDISYTVRLEPNSAEPPTVRTLETSESRSLIYTDRDSIPVFVPLFSLEGYDKSNYYSLMSNVTIEDSSDLERVIEAAQKNLTTEWGEDFGYTFNLSPRSMAGRSVENLLHDFDNIRQTIGKIISKDQNPQDDHRPIIVVGAASTFGIFFIEIYWKHGRVARSRVGLIMDDIPFDDRPIKRFFSEIDESPAKYSQQAMTKQFELKGPIQLRNPVPIDFPIEDPLDNDKIEHVEVDNPFYDRAEEIVAKTDGPIPNYLIEGFSDFERMVFEINDVFYEDSGESFYLNYIDVVYQHLSFGTYFIDSGCWGAHSEYFRDS